MPLTETTRLKQQKKTLRQPDLAAQLKRHIPTPYVETDLAIVRRNVADFCKYLPQVEAYYAIKANRDEPVIRAVDPLVAGYDIASLGELLYLLKLGISADRILYSNPVKIPRHIQKAYQLGVRYFAFDSMNEITKLAQYAPGSNVYLRLKVSDYGSKFPLSKKFGLDPLYAVDYCSIAKEAGLKVKGVTFHVGSQSENIQAWRTALEIAGRTIGALQASGMDIEFVDIGGGFPSDYGEPVPRIRDVAIEIRRAAKMYLPKNVKLIAEPGRFMAANASTMVASVIAREHRSGADWLYLDVGTFQGLIEPLEMPNWKYPVWADTRPSGSKRSFVLTGPTCDAFDTIGSDYSLPADMKMGDKVYIGSVGAYTSVYASEFNGFKPPKHYYVNGEAAQL